MVLSGMKFVEYPLNLSSRGDNQTLLIEGADILQCTYKANKEQEHGVDERDGEMGCI